MANANTHIFIDVINHATNETAKAMVDVDDARFIRPFEWHIGYDGCATTDFNGFRYNMEHLILRNAALNVTVTIEHRNGNKLDNRKLNLKIRYAQA